MKTIKEELKERDLLIDFCSIVYEKIYFTWDRKTSEIIVDDYLKGVENDKIN